jgi:antiviral helicase SLH1
MASSRPPAAEEWFAKFEAMKASLRELGLATDAAPATPSEDDAEFRGRGESVWDFLSDDDETDEDGGGGADGYADETATHSAYDTAWLLAKCTEIGSRAGLAGDSLHAQISALLASPQTPDELQSHLIDLVGFDDLDFVIELLGHRDELTRDGPTTAGGASSSFSAGPPRLLTREEREEALRRRDREHKTAALAGPTMRDVEYPHVYRSYNAGNTISHGGQKYGLPAGAERREFDKYEEYFVPAGKAGTLAPGRRLVDISELDGLCRGTFRGYKSLNRMQSLVYPVAYRTSENMLICAPTGAVSGGGDERKRGHN